eukprot:Selendium_serpulae@DN7926_c1_g1_i1.p1
MTGGQDPLSTGVREAVEEAEANAVVLTHSLSSSKGMAVYQKSFFAANDNMAFDKQMAFDKEMGPTASEPLSSNVAAHRDSTESLPPLPLSSSSSSSSASRLPPFI